MAKVGNIKKFIKAFYYANKPLKTAKDPLSHIDVRVKDEYVGDIIREKIPSFSDYAKMHGLNVKLVQKGDVLLINSGIYTSVSPLRERKAIDIYKDILDNLQKNALANQM